MKLGIVYDEKDDFTVNRQKMHSPYGPRWVAASSGLGLLDQAIRRGSRGRIIHTTWRTRWDKTRGRGSEIPDKSINYRRNDVLTWWSQANDPRIHHGVWKFRVSAIWNDNERL